MNKNIFHNIIKSKKGSDYLVGVLIVATSLGIGTLAITYSDYHSQPILQTSNESGSTSIVMIEDTMNAISFQNMKYKYRTNISLGNNGNAYLEEETISKTACVYSGVVSLSSGDNYGVRVTITIDENGEKTSSIGFSNTNSLPITYIQYLLDASQKMYNYRFE